jgi:tetratricopeptide (TPR) repeat protein
VIGARRAVALLWPIALFAAFVGTFRRTAPETRGGADAIDCERPIQRQTADADPVRVLERCLSLDPSNVELMMQLGAADESSGRIDRAEATYRRALAVDPRNGDVHVRLGALLLNRGDRDGARAAAESALRWHPNSAGAADLAARASRGANANPDRGRIR